MGGGAETRAAAPGGISAGARGVGAGMRGASGCEEGIDGGWACDGAAAAGSFTSAGVFAAAGWTGFGCTGAGGAGSFCVGVLAGAIGTGAAVMGEGSCDFCSGCGSGFFSGMGNDNGAGSLTGTDKSTCGVGTGVSLAAGAAGRCVNSLATGPAGWTAALSWRLRS